MTCRAYRDFRHESPVMFDKATRKAQIAVCLGGPTSLAKPSPSSAKPIQLITKSHAAQVAKVTSGNC